MDSNDFYTALTRLPHSYFNTEGQLTGSIAGGQHRGETARKAHDAYKPRCAGIGGRLLLLRRHGGALAPALTALARGALAAAPAALGAALLWRGGGARRRRTPSEVVNAEVEDDDQR